MALRPPSSLGGCWAQQRAACLHVAVDPLACVHLSVHLPYVPAHRSNVCFPFQRQALPIITTEIMQLPSNTTNRNSGIRRQLPKRSKAPLEMRHPLTQGNTLDLDLLRHMCARSHVDAAPTSKFFAHRILYSSANAHTGYNTHTWNLLPRILCCTMLYST